MSLIINLEQPNKPEGKENNVFKALPTGDYQGMVIGAELKQTKTNRPQLEIKLKLVGEKRVQGAMLDGRKESYRILLDTDFTPRMLNSVLFALGYNNLQAIDVNKMIESNALIGKMCSVHLVESSYITKDGETKPCNEIKWLNKIKEVNTSFTIDDDDIPF